MEDNCKNCGTLITGNFCNNCGQKKYKRIDRKYLIDELQYTFLHTNKGFFYSVKNIIKNPGKSARDFIDGNRVNHYKPLLLAFVLTGLSTFISFKILNAGKIMEAAYEKQKIPKTFIHDMMTFMSNYNSLVMLLFIPFVSIITYLLFKNWKNNYYEHVIMNAFIQNFYNVSCIIILYPILFLLKYISTDTYLVVSMLYLLIFPFILYWFYREFYFEKSQADVILKVVLFIVLGIVAYIVVVILAIIGMLAYYGPEKFVKIFAVQ